MQITIMSDNYGLQSISTFYSPWGNGRDWLYIGDPSYRGGKSSWVKNGALRKTPAYGKPSSRSIAKLATRPSQLPRAHTRFGPSGDAYMFLEPLEPLHVSRTLPPGLRHQPTSTIPRAHHFIGCNGDVIPAMEPLPPRSQSAPSGDILRANGLGRCRSAGNLSRPETEVEKRPASASASPARQASASAARLARVSSSPAIPFQSWSRRAAGEAACAADNCSQVSTVVPSVAP